MGVLGGIKHLVGGVFQEVGGILSFVRSIPKNEDLSHRDQVLFLFLFRFRSLTFATQTKSCFAFGECFIPIIFGALCTKKQSFSQDFGCFFVYFVYRMLCSKSNFLH